MKTGHVGLNVTDVRRAKEFYSAVFGFEVAGESEEAGRRFVFLSDDGALVLTLWEQADGAFSSVGSGLHHLSFQVDSMDEVRRFEGRVREAGGEVFHGGIVAHQEGAQSGGLFFADPDGIRLEVYAPSGAPSDSAPSGSAPTCGFF